MRNFLIVCLLSIFTAGCVTLPENTHNGMGRILIFSDTDNAGSGPFFDYRFYVRNTVTDEKVRINVKATKVSSYMLSDELEPGKYEIDLFAFIYRDGNHPPSERHVKGDFEIKPDTVTLYDMEIHTVLKGYTQYVELLSKEQAFFEQKFSDLKERRPALQTWPSFWKRTTGFTFQK